MLDAKPRVFPDLRPYWDAFLALDAQRSAQWQADPIHERDVLAYVTLERVPVSEWRNLRRAVRLLDRERLRVLREEQRRER